MDEQPGVSDQYRMASPWPMFVALGFVLSELGLFLGVFAISVGGVVLFGGTAAGILTEAGYVTHLWKTAAVVGALLGVIGTALIVLQGQFGVDVALAAIDRPNVVGHRLLSRGLSILAAGLILVATGLVGKFGQRPTR